MVIPCRNAERTLGECLSAAFASDYERFEVIVVDDHSSDDSAEIATSYGCRLIRLSRHGGASAARNAGARAALGEVLFFIDSDCVLKKDTLGMVAALYRKNPDAITGGTYTPIAHDSGFFSTFQSLFIHYSETKRPEPDYVATHAMIIGKELFDRSGGFREDFLPIFEDVEFCHRLRRRGVRLLMESSLQVGHIFNFSLWGSLKNAVRKARFWTIYSLGNRDLLADSGTASWELKANTASWPLWAGLLSLYALGGRPVYALSALLVLALNLAINRRFLAVMLRAAGPSFTVKAALYYMLVYPLAVGTGGLLGVLRVR